MANKSITTIALFIALNLLVLSNVAYSSYIPNPTTQYKSCPMGLDLKVCADVLNLIDLRVGEGRNSQCCNLVGNLIKLDAAACLCTQLKANLLDIIKLNLDLKLTALVNYCDCKLPAGFHCPN